MYELLSKTVHALAVLFASLRLAATGKVTLAVEFQLRV